MRSNEVWTLDPSGGAPFASLAVRMQASESGLRSAVRIARSGLKQLMRTLAESLLVGVVVLTGQNAGSAMRPRGLSVHDARAACSDAASSV